jgi:hypothetical protein
MWHDVWAWYPGVGWFISILGLLGVLVPFFRDPKEMSKTEKAIWTLVMFGLLVLELRSITLDQRHHDKEQIEARDRQVAQFKATVDQAQEHFDGTMGAFSTTIKKEEQATMLLQQTIKNTEPRAIVTFQHMDSTDPRPRVLSVGSQLEFNISFTNIGNEDAREVEHASKLYIAKPDDRETQEELARQFDKWVQSGGNPPSATTIPSYRPDFYTFKGDPLSADDINRLTAKTATIYVFMRFFWTDHNGHWVKDVCFGYQDPSHDLIVSHVCFVNNESPHKVRTH